MANGTVSRYEIDKFANIFFNDREFKEVVVKEYEITALSLDHPEGSQELENAKNIYRDFIELLLFNREVIGDNIIDYFFNYVANALVDKSGVKISTTRLRELITQSIGLQFLPQKVYRQILYTFKYSTLKTFFRDNWEKFVPDFDALNIMKSDQLKLFQEAFMREFDRLSDTIEEIYNIQDVEKIPNQYLNYLAQAIGYEREDEDFLYDVSFRELIKNIIEIYKIKGTNFSFELFFNFLGFEAVVREFWFDKRFSDPGISSNPYTGFSDRQSFGFYLTTERPTDYIPDNMRVPYSVFDNQIIETLDGNVFTRLARLGEYTPDELLGNIPGYPETPYTFFKTNIMEFSLERFSADAGSVEEDGGLSADELKIIRLYANFLTPIFIGRNIVVITRPSEDEATQIVLSDKNREDPRATNTAVNNETMFHMYSGLTPTGYYWEDGVRYWNYNDPILPEITNNRRWYGYGKSIEPGGHFISNYYNNTYDAIFNPLESSSVYSQIAAENPSWDQSDIYLYLNEIENGINYTITGDVIAGTNEITNVSSTEGIFSRYILKNVFLDKTFYFKATGNTGSNIIEIVSESGVYFKHLEIGNVFDEIPGVITAGTSIVSVNFTTFLDDLNNNFIQDPGERVFKIATVTLSNSLESGLLSENIGMTLSIETEAIITNVNDSLNTITINGIFSNTYSGKNFDICGDMFKRFGVFDRDILYSFVDSNVINPEAKTYFLDSFARGTYQTFASETKPKEYQDNWNKLSYYQAPAADSATYNRARIQSITASNANGVGEVVITDLRNVFSDIKHYDKNIRENRLFADLNSGSNEITNVEFSLKAAPVFTERHYDVGDLVREPVTFSQTDPDSVYVVVTAPTETAGFQEFQTTEDVSDATYVVNTTYSFGLFLDTKPMVRVDVTSPANGDWAILDIKNQIEDFFVNNGIEATVEIKNFRIKITSRLTGPESSVTLVDPTINLNLLSLLGGTRTAIRGTSTVTTPTGKMNFDYFRKIRGIDLLKEGMIFELNNEAYKIESIKPSQKTVTLDKTINIIDPRRELVFYKNKVNFEDRMFATFTKGSNKITELEFTFEEAPYWTQKEYLEGELVREPISSRQPFDNLVYVCSQDYDATQDSVMNKNIFLKIKGIDTVKPGWYFKIPYDVFSYKIERIESVRPNVGELINNSWFYIKAQNGDDHYFWYNYDNKYADPEYNNSELRTMISHEIPIDTSLNSRAEIIQKTKDVIDTIPGITYASNDYNEIRIFNGNTSMTFDYEGAGIRAEPVTENGVTHYSIYFVSTQETERRIKTVFLDRKLPVTSNREKIKLFDKFENFIVIKNSVDNRNDGYFFVESTEHYDIGGIGHTKLILSDPLVQDQNTSGGFTFLYSPKIMMEQRIPFLYNVLETNREFVGTSLTSYEDMLEMIMHFEFYGLSSQLNMRSPHISQTIGANYSDWPKLGRRDTVGARVAYQLQDTDDLFITDENGSIIISITDNLKPVPTVLDQYLTVLELELANYTQRKIKEDSLVSENTFYKKSFSENLAQSNYFIDIVYNGNTYTSTKTRNTEDGSLRTSEEDYLRVTGEYPTTSFAIRHKGNSYEYVTENTIYKDYVDIIYN